MGRVTLSQQFVEDFDAFYRVIVNRVGALITKVDSD